ncbi:39S ribosomal protein L51, mitochondrial-like [Asterias rubens]|uniref:39S ribosomal protein L51, mitochondrial-like n=1 Tax=Asterias rubens TaxID=7604 RepID=UPI001455A003|nr:39S ribosomal protein L51, mitochondrial-like [Asterias rubens]
MMSLLTRTATVLMKPALCSIELCRHLSKGAVALVNKKTRPSTESLIKWNRLPDPKTPRKDRWSEKRALFGENDYKDILGDGSYSLKFNVKTGPKWMHGWRGNELQTLIRKKKVAGPDMGPTKFYNMLKRISYLHKRFNRNKGRWQYRDKYEPNYRERM